jgi:hypothetical protein
MSGDRVIELDVRGVAISQAMDARLASWKFGN